MSGPSQVTQTGFFWELQRPDGAGFATTSRGVDDANSTTIYRKGSLAFEEMKTADDAFASELRVNGNLAEEALSRDDLLAGRWDGASVLLSIGERAESVTPLCAGRLAAAWTADAVFHSSVSIEPCRSDEPVGITLSQRCRARLGDGACRIDLRTRSVRTSVTASSGREMEVADPLTALSIDGRLLWLTGPNAGTEQVVASIDGTAVELLDLPPFAPRAGDRVRIIQGCDGLAATCATRFDNIANFRGEPTLPGTDVVIRYPGD